MGTWKKMDFWEQRELGKNGFRETWEGVGNDQKKFMPLPNVQTHQ